jgi:hypothetical protein
VFVVQVFARDDGRKPGVQRMLLSAGDPMDMKTTKKEGRRAWRALGRALASSGLSVLLHAVLILLVLHFAMGSRTPERATEIVVKLVEDRLPELETLAELDPLEDVREDFPEEFAEMPAESVPEALAVAVESVMRIEDDLGAALIVPVLADNRLSADQLARGQGTAFGFRDRARGDLVGTMYDLKRDRSGKLRQANFMDDLQFILNHQLEPGAFNNFFRVPRSLYLSHLYVPYMDANAGPEAFGVGDLMESRNWLVHYRGYLQAAIAGRYRFVGLFDDLLMVQVDGTPVFEFVWSGAATSLMPTDYVDRHHYRNGKHLVYNEKGSVLGISNRLSCFPMSGKQNAPGFQ